MTEKRFTRSKSLDGDCTIYDELNDFEFPSLPQGVSEIFCVKFNELHEENQFLKEKEMDMLDYLKKEYDYVYKQRMKHLDDAILVRSYELIEYHIRSMIEHLARL